MLLLLLVFHFRWAILLPSRCRIVGMGMNAVNNEEKKTRNCQSRTTKRRKKVTSTQNGVKRNQFRWEDWDEALGILDDYKSDSSRIPGEMDENYSNSSNLRRCSSLHAVVQLAGIFVVVGEKKRKYKPRFDVMSRWWGKGERRKGRSTRVGLSWRCQSIATLLIDVLGAAPGKRRMWRCSHKLVIQWVCCNEIAINMELFSILYTLSFHFWIKAFVL